MSYTEKQLYEFMESQKPVKVTSVNGTVYTGLCWAYSEVVSEEDYGIAEPTLDVGCSVLLALSEIQKIEYAD